MSRLGGAAGAVWMLRARLGGSRGRVDEAVASLGHVADDDPLGPQARLKEGHLERRRHRFRAAEAALDAGRQGRPTAQAGADGADLPRRDETPPGRPPRPVPGRWPSSAPLTSRELIYWCRDWNAVEKPDETVAALGPVVAADPGDRQARLVLVGALRLLGRDAEAEALLSALPESDPDALAARARMALDRGDEAAADSLLARGPSDHPGLARLRGRRALARHDADGAVRQFEIARAAEPDDRETLFGLGHALRLAGRAAEAEPLLRAARDQDALSGLVQRVADAPSINDPDLLLRFGAACEALGRRPEARGWYNLAVALDPLNADAQKALFRLKGPPPAAGPVSRRAVRDLSGLSAHRPQALTRAFCPLPFPFLLSLLDFPTPLIRPGLESRSVAW